MSCKNLYFLGLGRVSDGSVLIAYADQVTASERNDAQQAFSKFLTDIKGRVGPDGRDKRQFSGGLMFMLLETKNYVYAVASRNKLYPERFAQKCIQATKTVVQTKEGLPNINTITTPATFNRLLKADLSKIMREYDDLSVISSTHAVQAKVDDVRNVMNDNIYRVGKVGGDLNVLEAKAAELDNNASQLEANARALEKKIRNRQMRMILVGCTMIIVCLCYLAITIVDVTGV